MLSDNYLIHYGVLGQKWGVRRYQNEDGSYKPGAEGRYNPESSGLRSLSSKISVKKANSKSSIVKAKSKEKPNRDEYKNSEEYKEKRAKALKTAAIVGGTVAAAGLAYYGSKKISSISADVKSYKVLQDRLLENVMLRDLVADRMHQDIEYDFDSRFRSDAESYRRLRESFKTIEKERDDAYYKLPRVVAKAVGASRSTPLDKLLLKELEAAKEIGGLEGYNKFVRKYHNSY